MRDAKSNQTPIRVAVVEDSLATRESLIELLRRAPTLQCAGAYRSAEEALRQISAGHPDVVLLDINLPRMNGIECVAHLRERLPGVEVLMLTTFDDSDLIFEALRNGANGYLLKNGPPAELIEAITQVHAGGAPMSLQIARKVVNYFHQIKSPRTELDKLTPREQEVLALLAQGYLYKEVADRLSITLSTVRAHLHLIYEKLHVHNRTEATVMFLGDQHAAAAVVAKSGPWRFGLR